jgi:phosphoribosylcarboxyaminoimidazole (NCAIR) mutase
MEWLDWLTEDEAREELADLEEHYNLQLLSYHRTYGTLDGLDRLPELE